MKFKGTIIITDPCYVMREPKEEAPNFSTWKGLEGVTTCTKFTEYTAEQLAAYKEYEAARKAFYDKYNDWNKCECGRNMEALGISHYITESTIYGDWGCSTYQIQENPKETIDKLAAACKAPEDEYVGVGVKVIKDLGSFCADAGLVSVFYLDEVLKYNPDFDKWAEKHSWCVTTIPDFDGGVEYYVDANSEAHIIGTGNINFLTIQTSL